MTTEDAGTTVGDPTADRRIRRIVLVLCAVAAVVLLVTIMFWRATRPVPKVLEGLQQLGSRSGRRQTTAARPAVDAEAVVGPLMSVKTGAVGSRAGTRCCAIGAAGRGGR